MLKLKIISLAVFSTICLKAQWVIPTDLTDQIDAAVYSETQESVLFFASDILMFNSFFLEQQVEPIAIWEIPNFPEDWNYLDAAMAFEPTKLLLFKGQTYCEFDLNTLSITEQALWEGLPSEWSGQLDAAVNWEENNFLFFLGNEYVVYDATIGEYGEPDLIVNWEGWPSQWKDGFAAATNIGDGNIYFFRGNEFLAFNLTDEVFVGPMPMTNETTETKN